MKEENKQVRIAQENGKWWASANTENSCGDFYYVTGKSRKEVIEKLRSSIKKEKEDRWLLDNPLLN